jgi:hypothetical protein
MDGRGRSAVADGEGRKEGPEKGRKGWRRRRRRKGRRGKDDERPFTVAGKHGSLFLSPCLTCSLSFHPHHHDLLYKCVCRAIAERLPIFPPLLSLPPSLSPCFPVLKDPASQHSAPDHPSFPPHQPLSFAATGIMAEGGRKEGRRKMGRRKTRRGRREERRWAKRSEGRERGQAGGTLKPMEPSDSCSSFLSPIHFRPLPPVLLSPSFLPDRVGEGGGRPTATVSDLGSV